jgi:hypothetical protein
MRNKIRNVKNISLLTEIAVRYINQSASEISRKSRARCYYTVRDLINALPGNSYVHMFQHAKMEEAVFSVDPTDAPIDWLDSDHVTYIYCRSMSVPRLYNEGHELYVQSELQLGVQKSTRGQPVKI